MAPWEGSIIHSMNNLWVPWNENVALVVRLSSESMRRRRFRAKHSWQDDIGGGCHDAGTVGVGPGTCGAGGCHYICHVLSVAALESPWASMSGATVCVRVCCHRVVSAGLQAVPKYQYCITHLDWTGHHYGATVQRPLGLSQNVVEEGPHTGVNTSICSRRGLDHWGGPNRHCMACRARAGQPVPIRHVCATGETYRCRTGAGDMLVSLLLGAAVDTVIQGMQGGRGGEVLKGG